VFILGVVLFIGQAPLVEELLKLLFFEIRF
jgi:hypothetical protein